MIYYPQTALKTINVLQYAADNGVNCIFSDGGVSPAGKAEKSFFNLPENVVDIKHIKPVNKYVAVAADGAYVSEYGKIFTKLFSFTDGEPYIAEDFSGEKRAVIICGKTLLYYTPDGYTVSSTECVTKSGVMHNGRIFALDSEDRYVLRWTESGERGWSVEKGGGWLKVNSDRGEILGVYNYKNRLILLREYGLTVVSAFGVSDNFKTEANYSCDRIYASSAAVAGGKFVFFTGAGLCMFDGNGIEKANWRYSRHITLPFCAAACGQSYYLSCACDLFEDNVTLFYDAFTGESGVLCGSAGKLFPLDGKMYSYYESKLWEIVRGSGGYVWKSKDINFGTGEKKVIKNLLLETRSPVDITVENGAVSRKYDKVTSGKLPVRLCGKSFRITLESSGEITGLKAAAEVHDGV